MELAIVVVMRDNLLRAGFRACLKEPRYRICREFDSISNALEPGVDTVDVIIIAENSMSEFLKDQDSLRERYPTARLVLYAQAAPSDAAEVTTLLQTKLDGILTSDMTAEVLRQFIELIMMGERAVSFSFVVSTFRRQRELTIPRYLKRTAGTELSERERRVLRLLASGLSNKVIARRLSVSPTTIKAQLHTIIRKVGVVNRTQAAVWALEHDAYTGSQDPTCTLP